MGHYNYHKDKKIAENTEKEVANILEELFDIEVVEYNNDYRYDIRVKRGDIEYTIEIKEDFMCKDTGNIAVEFFCRGEPSGISTTEANFYIYKVHNNKFIHYLMIPTKQLKIAIENNMHHREVSGGDKGSNTKNYLFDFDTFWMISKQIYRKNYEKDTS